MDQDNKPRFSHISIGGTTAEKLSEPEQEEVTIIGAAEVASVPSAGADAQVLDEDISATARAAGRADAQTDKSETQGRASEDLDLGAPMPLLQKLVLVACLIGVVVTITFLVWFWGFSR
jgi:hypothetical protein